MFGEYVIGLREFRSRNRPDKNNQDTKSGVTRVSDEQPRPKRNKPKRDRARCAEQQQETRAHAGEHDGKPPRRMPSNGLKRWGLSDIGLMPR